MRLSALLPVRVCYSRTYIATGEVSSLEHELGDDTVEGRTSVSESLLAGAESAEVLSSLWDNVVVEVEVDATGLLWKKIDVSMVLQKAVLDDEVGWRNQQHAATASWSSKTGLEIVCKLSKADCKVH